MSVAEERRVAAVQQFDALTGEPMPELEAVARLAARVCAVPKATVNLLTADEQHEIATEGFIGEVRPREQSMCTVTITEPEPVYVVDARTDPRWKDNPWVNGELGQVRFYAASQLRTSGGEAIGTLCVFDEEEHVLDEEQRRALDDLAQQLVSLLEVRREARALRRSNADLEAFTGRVAHDLRSPLAAVQGFLQLASSRFTDELGPRAATCVTSALAGAQRMNDLLSELLRFASAAGQAQLVDVDLRPLADEVLADCSADIAASEASVVLDIDAAMQIRTDRSLIRQVMQNLLVNAVRYRHPDRAPVVTVSATGSGAVWSLTVSDNGLGVPIEDRERIFDVLTRGSNVTAVPGTGIGLATCARLVEAMGGSIEVGGVPDAGATFTVTFPASR